MAKPALAAYLLLMTGAAGLTVDMTTWKDAAERVLSIAHVLLEKIEPPRKSGIIWATDGEDRTTSDAEVGAGSGTDGAPDGT